MNHILKLYYGIENHLTQSGYFYHQNQLYYLAYIQDIPRFLEIYQYYRYLINQCQCHGYSCIKNFNEDIVSHQYILFLYHQEDIDFTLYLNAFLQPIPYQKMMIKQIKEQWICKIDKVKDLVKQYAYSFKHNPDLVSLIYYYTGLAENCISILNEILLISQTASVPMGLALCQTVTHYIYDLMNPTHYIISTRMRHLVYLLKSELINCYDIKELLEKNYFDVYEILYFYARLFYPSTFFDEVLTKEISKQRIQEYFEDIKKERQLYQNVTHLLSFYVTLPKISWLNRQNML